MISLNKANLYKIDSSEGIYADCGYGHGPYVSAASTSYQAPTKYYQLTTKNPKCEFLGNWSLEEFFEDPANWSIQSIIGYSTIYDNGDTSFAKVMLNDFKFEQRIAIGFYIDKLLPIGKYYIIDQPIGMLTLPDYRETEISMPITEDIKISSPYTVFIKDKSWHIGFDTEADYMEVMLSK